MTTDLPFSTAGAGAPPPGCPAHDGSFGPGGLRRLHGPEAEKDQRGFYEALRREHGPVAPILLHDDVPAWLVLGHAENVHVVTHPEEFSVDSRHWIPLKEGRVRPDHPMAPIFTWQPVCAFVEGPEHKRLRGAVTDSLVGADGRGVRRLIQDSTILLVNEFCEDGHGDIVSDFATRLPMMVMLGLLGLPEAYDDRLVQAAQDLIKGTETANASNEYLMVILRRHVERRIAEPAEDFTGRLLAHPSGLTAQEVAEHLRIVLIASYETTANLIANAARIALTDRRVRTRLGAGQMTLQDATEQALWDEPPFSALLGRYAVDDIELGGQRIRKGDAVMLGFAAANTDPAIRPDLKANLRGNRAHLAFGGGPHACPGADLGRSIADLGIDELFTRLSDAQLAVEPEDLRWSGSILARHLVEVPVRFAPKPQVDPRTVDASGAPRQPDDIDWLLSDDGASLFRPANRASVLPEPAPEPRPLWGLPVQGPGLLDPQPELEPHPEPEPEPEFVPVSDLLTVEEPPSRTYPAPPAGDLVASPSGGAASVPAEVPRPRGVLGRMRSWFGAG